MTNEEPKRREAQRRRNQIAVDLEGYRQHLKLVSAEREAVRDASPDELAVARDRLAAARAAADQYGAHMNDQLDVATRFANGQGDSRPAEWFGDDAA